MKPRLGSGRLPSQLGLDITPPAGIPTAVVALIRASGLIATPARAVAAISDTPRAVGQIAFVRPVALVATPDRPIATIEVPL